MSRIVRKIYLPHWCICDQKTGNSKFIRFVLYCLNLQHWKVISGSSDRMRFRKVFTLWGNKLLMKLRIYTNKIYTYIYTTVEIDRFPMRIESVYRKWTKIMNIPVLFIIFDYKNYWLNQRKEQWARTLHFILFLYWF